MPSLLRHPIAANIGAGILTSFPSTTPFGLALGSDSPCADERCAGTLGLSARRIFTSFIVTHVSIRTSDTSRVPHGYSFTGLQNVPLPLIKFENFINPQIRYMILAPLHLRRRNSIRPVSCYAIFKGWLLLSQPPGCLGLPTSFPT